MSAINIPLIVLLVVTCATTNYSGDITPGMSDQIRESAQQSMACKAVVSGGENVTSNSSSSTPALFDESQIAKEFEKLHADGKYEQAARLLMKQWATAGLSGPLRMKLHETQEKLGWKTLALRSIVSIHIYEPKPEYLAKIAIMAFELGDRDFAEDMATSLLNDNNASVGVKRDMAYMMVHINADRRDMVSTERYLALLREYSGGEEEALRLFSAIVNTAKGNYEEATRDLDMASKNVGGPTDDLPFFTQKTFSVLQDRPEYWTAVTIIVQRTAHERKQREYLYDAVRNAMGKKPDESMKSSAISEEINQTPK